MRDPRPWPGTARSRATAPSQVAAGLFGPSAGFPPAPRTAPCPTSPAAAAPEPARGHRAHRAACAHRGTSLARDAARPLHPMRPLCGRRTSPSPVPIRRAFFRLGQPLRHPPVRTDAARPGIGCMAEAGLLCPPAQRPPMDPQCPGGLDGRRTFGRPPALLIPGLSARFVPSSRWLLQPPHARAALWSADSTFKSLHLPYTSPPPAAPVDLLLRIPRGGDGAR